MLKTVSFGRNVPGRNVHVYGAKRPGAKRLHVWGELFRRRIVQGVTRPHVWVELSRGESSRGRTVQAEDETSRQMAKRLGG